MIIIFTKKNKKTKEMFLKFLEEKFKNLNDHKMIITNKSFKEEIPKILEDDTVVLINFKITKKQLSKGTWSSVFFNTKKPGFYWIAVTKSFFERINFDKDIENIKPDDLIKKIKEELNEESIIKLIIKDDSSFTIF